MLQAGGAGEGWRWLDGFLNERGEDYTRAMSSPVQGAEACSRVSPYLAWGALSVRQVYQASRQRYEELKGRPVGESRLWRRSVRSFASRLRWHCHFMQKLEDFPQLDRMPMARAYAGLRVESWREDFYEAWCLGQTGFPMVDACMRSLRQTGWLNFRMRAMLISFSSYHLWLDWRLPGQHLARLFLDYEPGIHWSQVQMQSGTTGINTVRVYSPVKQAFDQDPQGEFIRRWVPELVGVPQNYLAAPWKMPEMEQMFANCRIGKDYPAPLVDHLQAYHDAHQRIHEIRTRPNARHEARQIQAKHGSRKPGQRSLDGEWR